MSYQLNSYIVGPYQLFYEIFVRTMRKLMRYDENFSIENIFDKKLQESIKHDI